MVTVLFFFIIFGHCSLYHVQMLTVFKWDLQAVQLNYGVEGGGAWRGAFRCKQNILSCFIRHELY